MKILGVCVARSELLTIQGQAVPSAINKRAMVGPVAVRPLGLDGDEQADQSVHGGLSKAIYAYPAAHYPFWQGVRGQAGVAGADPTLPHGSLGENLTIEGLLKKGCGSATACACPVACWRSASRASPATSSTT